MPDKTGSSRWRRTASVALGVLLGAAFTVMVVTVILHRLEAVAAPTRLDLILMPHPDDEMEAWALVEDATDVYQVFVYATLGEETSYCAPELPGYQEGTGERAPRSIPGGTYSSDCEDERVSSVLWFLNQMAETDEGLPGGFEESELRFSEPLSARGTELIRIDASAETPADRRARFVDGGEQGMVMFWDMGDGDLVSEEVAWIVETVLAEREKFGIPDLPWDRLIGGSYFNGGAFADCLTYPHPDHEAIHDTLWGVRFPEFSAQIAPTCHTDPRVALDGVVAHFDDAMLLGDEAPDGFRWRLGAHNIHYGWLKSPYHAGDWFKQGQIDGELIHRNQYFWVRRS